MSCPCYFYSIRIYVTCTFIVKSVCFQWLYGSQQCSNTSSWSRPIGSKTEPRSLLIGCWHHETISHCIHQCLCLCTHCTKINVHFLYCSGCNFFYDPYYSLRVVHWRNTASYLFVIYNASSQRISAFLARGRIRFKHSLLFLK